MPPKTPPPQLYSRSEFARIAGVSPPAIGKQCKPGGKLYSACSADRIDARSPAAVEYLKAHGKRPPRSPAKPKPPEPVDELDSTDPDQQAELDRVEPYADMTLREIVDAFGSRRAFKDWLEALLKIEGVRQKRLDNDEVEGTLISRELVNTHIFGALEALSRRLLQDMPKTAARLIHGSVKAGEPVEETEKILRELVSKQIKPTKAEASRKLRGA